VPRKKKEGEKGGKKRKKKKGKSHPRTSTGSESDVTTALRLFAYSFSWLLQRASGVAYPRERKGGGEGEMKEGRGGRWACGNRFQEDFEFRCCTGSAPESQRHLCATSISCALHSLWPATCWKGGGRERRKKKEEKEEIKTQPMRFPWIQVRELEVCDPLVSSLHLFVCAGHHREVAVMHRGGGKKKEKKERRIKKRDPACRFRREVQSPRPAFSPLFFKLVTAPGSLKMENEGGRGKRENFISKSPHFASRPYCPLPLSHRFFGFEPKEEKKGKKGRKWRKGASTDQIGSDFPGNLGGLTNVSMIATGKGGEGREERRRKEEKKEEGKPS